MKTGLLTGWVIIFMLSTSALFAQTYSIKRVAPGAVTITGRGDAKAWGKANTLTNFAYPWDSSAAPATSFAALWDGQWLYCLYRVKDDSIICPVHSHNKIDVGASDRVEIFLKASDSMSPYYCLELDATGRALDYQAHYYRQMNYAWQWPQGQLLVKASLLKDGYIVEFAIGIPALQQLGLLQNNRLQAGLFRAECKGIINGKADLHWISWIRPGVSQPDFHIPAAFGMLLLE